MTQIVTVDSRSALGRAKFFLTKAKECPADSRVEFEAYIEASIVFGRSAIHRVKSEYEKEAGFKKWWDSLLDEPSILFFRNERNWILKIGPSQLGQKLVMPLIKLNVDVGQTMEGDTTDKTDEAISYASDLYYFDDPSIPATQTVEDYVHQLEKHIDAFIQTLQ